MMHYSLQAWVKGRHFILAESILQKIPIIALKSHGVSEVVGKKEVFI